MSARDDLNAYISQVQRRLRVGALLRGGAVVVAVALVATLVLVWLARALLSSGGNLTAARLALLCALALSACCGIAVPLWRLTQRRAARIAEQRFPQFQQRLLTFTDHDTADPFLELLAADTLEVGRAAEPATLTSRDKLSAWLGLGVASAGVLIWLIVAAPGYMGYGAHMLWLHSPRGPVPRYDVAVSPGNATIRRHADQLITARPEGIHARQYVLYARFHSSAQWERVPMQPQSNASYQFVLTAVPEDVDYYVEAGTQRSRRFTIHTVDPPAIKQMRVTYHFPDWTGLKDQVEEPAGDLRALQGTQATLSITTDRPMNRGLLVLDNGQTVTLSRTDNDRYQGVLQLQQDGAYHVAYLDQGQAVRLSEDYFIEARKPVPPSVSIVRPGGDYRASPIEEITVAVHATDEFGLQQLELHYSVNGGPDQAVKLLPSAGLKQADGSKVLALEDYKLEPGDVISLYAVAKDAQLQSHTDINFIQVDPFARQFSLSQAEGGGGGGDEYGEVSQREKELIAETFKQLNDHGATAQQAAQSAKFLSEVQTALHDQSLALTGRLASRELTDQNREFSTFQKEMTDAAAAMDPSSQLLRQQRWQGAIPQEQKALQHLLRAEATIREIEIAYGARGGGGAGGAGRDLASLFDLELDTEKNQYETQQTATPADQRAKDINDALKKLDELAQRQEALAQRQRDDSTAAAEQRWQQELLQRQAQELQQQMEQLARAQSAGEQSSGEQAQQASESASAPGQAGRAGQATQQANSRSMQQAAQQALEQLRQAQQDMLRAAANARPADARLAAERLREAMNLLGALQSQQSTSRVDSIARQAQQLADAETEQSKRLQQMTTPGADRSREDEQIAQLQSDRQSMADALAALQQNMRNAARELDSGQRAAADKLRGALKDMDDSDLELLVQRTADWLRTGIDPNSNHTEANIAAGLQRLSDQTRQAQQAVSAAAQQPGTQDTEEALNQVARLRQQIEALAAQQGSQPGSQQGSDNQPGAAPGQQNYQASTLDRGGATGGQTGSPSSADAAGRIANGLADTRAGGGRANAFGYSNVDTGSNAHPGAPARAPIEALNPADSERLINQGLGELQALRGQTGNDAQAERQVQQLIAEMQHLDLRRFPGNPAMVEQIHQQLLSDVDTLELQLRRNLQGQQSGQIRAADPLLVPHGYEDAVADYFRRLSSSNPNKDAPDSR